MSIAILYESEEWSNVYLRDRLRSLGLEVRFINLEEPVPDKAFDGVKLIVNRLYPSAFFRGHEKTYFDSPDLVRRLAQQGFPMLNSWQAMQYDFSKALTNDALAEQGIPVPRLYGRTSDFGLKAILYPCIVKPDRGGRASFTKVIWEETSLLSFIDTLPAIEFLFQEYIISTVPYTIRAEVINGKVFSAVRRSIDSEGLSGLHLGSEYEAMERLDPELEALILKTFEVLDVRMGGIDLVMGEKGPYVIDVNATSNFSKKVIDLLEKNPLDEMAAFIERSYHAITGSDLLPVTHLPEDPPGNLSED